MIIAATVFAGRHSHTLPHTLPDTLVLVEVGEFEFGELAAAGTAVLRAFALIVEAFGESSNLPLHVGMLHQQKEPGVRGDLGFRQSKL